MYSMGKLKFKTFITNDVQDLSKVGGVKRETVKTAEKIQKIVDCFNEKLGKIEYKLGEKDYGVFDAPSFRLDVSYKLTYDTFDEMEVTISVPYNSREIIPHIVQRLKHSLNLPQKEWDYGARIYKLEITPPKRTSAFTTVDGEIKLLLTYHYFLALVSKTL